MDAVLYTWEILVLEGGKCTLYMYIKRKEREYLRKMCGASYHLDL